MRLLIAEDDRALSGFLARSMAGDADQVELAYGGQEAIEQFRLCRPDLLILDLELPLLSGLEVLASVRATSSVCPILVLSGRADAATRVLCLNQGADDCMQKPFSLAELRARCRALLRARLASEPAGPAALQQDRGTLQLGSLQMVHARHVVDLAGQRLPLTNCEFALLAQMLLAQGAPVPRRVLHNTVWEGREVGTNVIEVHVASLRRKLAQATARQALLARLPGAARREPVSAPVVRTIRGEGYALVLAPAAAGGFNRAGTPGATGEQL